jgi:hypothetical protein
LTTSILGVSAEDQLLHTQAWLATQQFQSQEEIEAAGEVALELVVGLLEPFCAFAKA